MPVMNEAGIVLGTIAMYYSEPREPTERDFGLLAPGARLVRLALVKHRNEEVLRASEASQRLAVEATDLGTFDIDLVTKKVVWSDRMKAILGLPKTAEPDHHTFPRLVHPADATQLLAGYEDWVAAPSTQPRHKEIRVLRAIDGAERIVSLSGRLLKNAEDKPIRAIGTCADVTEFRAAERNVREAAERFRQLFEIGSDYYWETDARYRVSYLSPNYEAVVGVSPEEALGKRLSDIPDVRIDPQKGRMALAAQKERRPYRDFVYSRKMHSGEIRWFSMNAVPKFGEYGEFQGYRGVAADVTARIDAERAADRMFSAAPVPMMLLDVEAQRYAEINDYAIALLGYSREQATAMPAEAFFAPDERERYRAVRNTPRPPSGRRGTWRYLKADGSELLIDITVHPIRPQGRTMAIVALVDVTDQRRIERRLTDARDAAEAASRAKSDFLANMSHELRTPLNAIIGFSQIMRDQMFGPLGAAQYHGYTADIHESGQHLLAVINDILDLAKIEANTFQLREELIGVGQVVESAVKFVRPRAGEAGVALAVENCAEGVQIVGDEIALKRVLINLVTNAVKFSETGTQVIVHCELTAQGDLTIAVKDRGIGMAPEDIPIALTPFRQIDHGLQRRYEGTGLGLPIAKQLVELHGGRLTIESALGQGTIVTMLLPRA